MNHSFLLFSFSWATYTPASGWLMRNVANELSDPAMVFISFIRFALWRGCFSTQAIVFYSFILISYMHKVSLNKGIKPQLIFLPPLNLRLGCFEDFFANCLNMSSEKHVPSVYFQYIILSNLNFDHLRLYDVELSCFSANGKFQVICRLVFA